MGKKTLQVETVAQAYLELLRDRGIDCFFANAGTDFASIVDAFARAAAEGRAAPRPLAVPHEFVAVSMAHGYYLVTGRPQAVMVHVTVGTANGVGAVINASIRMIEPRNPPDGRFQQAFEAGRRALIRCSPYELPREKFGQWRNIEVVFNPEGMVSW